MEDTDPTMAQNERKLGTVDKSFYLIGVGASAGGLDALKQLVSQIPAGFPHSMVVVQHISPDYKSLMSEILGRETSLPVQEVTDNMTVEPGHIYLIPPRSNIVIQGTEEDSNFDPTENDSSDFTGLRFSLVDPTPRPAMNLPIDIFFNSLAEAVQDRAVAIVLSGTGSDGSRGIRAVKDREGFVLVQDPKTAAFDGMPRAAIASGIVDLVQPPDGMVGEMRRYFQMRESGILNVNSVFEDTGDELAEILALVSKRSEIDFSLYKEPTLKRRIARRMALAGHSSLSEYLDPRSPRQFRTERAVSRVPCRRDELSFATNPPGTQLERNGAAGACSNEGNTDEPVRVWSVGCSTGRRGLYHRHDAGGLPDPEQHPARLPHLCDGCERSAPFMRQKKGIYPDNVREEIPSRFIRSEIPDLSDRARSASHRPFRKRVIFSTHNVIDDPPYTRMDLIVCRNLLIYLSPEVQAKVMTQFSFSLRRGRHPASGGGGNTRTARRDVRGGRQSSCASIRTRAALILPGRGRQTNYDFPSRRISCRARGAWRSLRRRQGESDLARSF